MEREKLIDLVQRAQKGDAEATEALFTAFYNDVYYFALKTVKDSDVAGDITQDAFIDIIRNIGSLQEPAAFVTWMKRITYNRCTRYFSRNKEVLVEEDEDGNSIFDTLADESEGSIPSEVLEQEEFRKTILSMIDQLTEEQRSAVMMFYFDDLNVAQIAEIQGVSAGTVKSRLNYARKAIKKSVEDYEKKHDIKLHSFSLLPLLMLFFGKEAMDEDKAAAIRAAVGDATATTTKIGVAAKAARSGGFIMKLSTLPLWGKITAAIVAVAIVAGAAVAIITNNAPKDEIPNDVQLEAPVTTNPSAPNSEPTTPADPSTPSEPPHQHAYVLTARQASTCAAEGYETYTCTCGATDQRVLAKSEDHKWNEYSKIQDATYFSTGIMQYKCSICKSMKDEPIAKLTMEEEFERLSIAANNCLSSFSSADNLAVEEVLRFVGESPISYENFVWTDEFGHSYPRLKVTYSMDSLNRNAELYFGRTYDFAGLATLENSIYGNTYEYDAANNYLIKITSGAGGETGPNSYVISYTTTDNIHYTVKYEKWWLDEETREPYDLVNSGTLELCLADGRFILMSHSRKWG